MPRGVNSEAVDALLARLPIEARHELQDKLGPIGRDIAAEQQALTPILRGRRKDRVPGFIRSQIRSVVDAEALRVVVGLPDLKGGRDPRYYARWVEYGRNAGSKAGVTRRLPGQKKGKKAARTRPYKITWPAIAARKFIHIEGKAREIALSRLGDFWANVLSKADA